jgi:hypothetical protein
VRIFGKSVKSHAVIGLAEEGADQVVNEDVVSVIDINDAGPLGLVALLGEPGFDVFAFRISSGLVIGSLLVGWLLLRIKGRLLFEAAELAIGLQDDLEALDAWWQQALGRFVDVFASARALLVRDGFLLFLKMPQGMTSSRGEQLVLQAAAEPLAGSALRRIADW